MSITVENNLKSINDSDLGKLHYIPSHIEGDGEANVKKYFEPYITKMDDSSHSASFRGHPLSGTTFPLPQGHSLTLVTEAKTPLGDEAHRNLKVKGQVAKDNIIYWNWDITPSQNDALYKATKWMALAEVLHKPLDLETNEVNLK